MQSQVLEQILEPVQRPEKAYVTIDLYTSGQFQMYTGQFKPINPFFPTATGFGINIPKPLKGINDYHETFKLDRYDNLYNGHSSVTINGIKIRLDHNE
ncbi:MAG: hypothetical protein KJ968_04290 [Nanoarchaeota archaeon]|nr:hypothetical protein [Nanoarchaeota archaeon]